MTFGPVPVAVPLTVPFWEGTRSGVLRIQRCNDCGRHYFYPRRVCRYCHSSNVEWTDTSGLATLASFIINFRPMPVFESKEPQIIALVDLAEGPRMATSIIDVAPDPQFLVVGMPLEVRFLERGPMMLPVFAPSGRNGE